METFLDFVILYALLKFGAFLGKIETLSWIWNNAEKIALTKMRMRKANIDRGIPILGFYKKGSKRLLPSFETLFMPAKDIVWQIPSRYELLKSRPGKKVYEQTLEWFYEYIIKRHMTLSEAVDQAWLDHPEKFRYSHSDKKNLHQAFYRLWNEYQEYLNSAIKFRHE
jgi:hypothetical protein